MIKEKSIKTWCRRQLYKKGLKLIKSRRQISINNYSGYQLVDNYRNIVLDGSNYDLSLDDVKWRIENFEKFYK